MLIKTHLAIVIFFILLFIPNIESKVLFVLVALAVTFIPDVDSRFSKLGQRKSLRVFQFFFKHRGFLHSFTFLLLITIFFALFLPVVAFPFFLSYSVHLFADSFTVEGIRPFYPIKKRISGKIRVGGKLETSIFVIFILSDLFLFIARISSLF